MTVQPFLRPFVLRPVFTPKSGPKFGEDLREKFRHKLFARVPEGQKYCFYPGTFNPVNNGHLFVAESALQKGFDRVVFIPAGIPPHRNEDIASSQDRLNIALLATAGHDRFLVSDIETDMTETSYTVDTLRKLLPGVFEKDQKTPFLIGSDALKHLASWKEPETLIKHLEFIQGVRPGSREVKSIRLKNGKRKKLTSQAIPFFDLRISGTLIREFVKLGRSVRYLVPEGVREYIESHGLWQPPKH